MRHGSFKAVAMRSTSVVEYSLGGNEAGAGVHIRVTGAIDSSSTRSAGRGLVDCSVGTGGLGDIRHISGAEVSDAGFQVLHVGALVWVSETGPLAGEEAVAVRVGGAALGCHAAVAGSDAVKRAAVAVVMGSTLAGRGSHREGWQAGLWIVVDIAKVGA